jgi:hypothetical protein
MRPRISQKEAAYLVKVLSLQTEQLEQKVSDIEQINSDMFRIICDLKHRVQVVYNEKGYFKDHRIVGDREALNLMHIYKELKAEHPNLLGEKFRLWECLSTHRILLAKYQAIANGEAHDGRYKKLRFSKAIYTDLATLKPLETEPQHVQKLKGCGSYIN